MWDNRTKAQRSKSRSGPGIITTEEACKRRDLSRGYGVFLVWGLPIAIDVLASAAQSSGWISLTLAGALWTTATAWIGVGCLINVRRCGRVHCAIAGSLLLPLSVAGVLNLSRVVSFSWDILGIYWDAFWVIVIAAFTVEFLWKPYYRS